ncbi:unnamed protein product, partial [Ostreobium quekettii]
KEKDRTPPPSARPCRGEVQVFAASRCRGLLLSPITRVQSQLRRRRASVPQ